MSTAVSKNAGTAPTGVTPPGPMPQYNGTLRILPGTPEVYLVLNSVACWVPDETTLQNLFIANPTIVSDPNLGEIKQGPPLTSGAVLAQANGTAPVYLVSNGVKMWIPNMDIFSAYQFNQQNIQSVAPILIDCIPTGPNVDGPTS